MYAKQIRVSMISIFLSDSTTHLQKLDRICKLSLSILSKQEYTNERGFAITTTKVTNTLKHKEDLDCEMPYQELCPVSIDIR